MYWKMLKLITHFTLIYYIDAVHKHILKLPKSSLDWGKIISATVFSGRCAGVAAERLQTDAILSIVTVMWEIFSDLSKNIVDMGDWVSVIIIHVLVNFKSSGLSLCLQENLQGNCLPLHHF